MIFGKTSQELVALQGKSKGLLCYFLQGRGMAKMPLLSKSRAAATGRGFSSQRGGRGFSSARGHYSHHQQHQHQSHHHSASTQFYSPRSRCVKIMETICRNHSRQHPRVAHTRTLTFQQKYLCFPKTHSKIHSFHAG